MKKGFLRLFVASAVSMTLILGGVTSKAASNEKEYKNVGYVFQRGSDISKLDVTKITHLNYSFGLIYNEEYKDLGVETNPDVVVPKDFNKEQLHTIYLPEKVASDLSRMGELRAKNPNLKILLSVGGWECRGFSDAASTEEAREIFAKSCKDVIDKYGLDGIDLDWEYPVVGGWGVIKSKAEDKENFTLLLQKVRDTIGKDKLLSIAGSGNVNFSNGGWTEFEKIIPILDYINIMTYDFRYGSCYFDSALYASKEYPTEFDYDDYNTDFAVQKYLAAGCPSEKINIGLSFSAGIPQIVSSKFDGEYSFILEALTKAGFFNENTPQLLAVKNLKEEDGFFKKWDNDAKAMYITYKDKEGKEYFVMSYIEPKGLSEKIKYIKDNNLGGTMFWEFGADYDNSLVAQIAKELNIKAPVIDDNKEEVPGKVENSAVKTGDKSSIAVIGGLSLVSLGVIGVILLRKKA